MEKNETYEKIESLRQEMYEIQDENKDLMNSQLLDTSRKLDGELNKALHEKYDFNTLKEKEPGADNNYEDSN